MAFKYETTQPITLTLAGLFLSLVTLYPLVSDALAEVNEDSLAAEQYVEDNFPDGYQESDQCDGLLSEDDCADRPLYDSCGDPNSDNICLTYGTIAQIEDDGITVSDFKHECRCKPRPIVDTDLLHHYLP